MQYAPNVCSGCVKRPLCMKEICKRSFCTIFGTFKCVKILIWEIPRHPSGRSSSLSFLMLFEFSRSQLLDVGGRTFPQRRLELSEFPLKFLLILRKHRACLNEEQSPPASTFKEKQKDKSMLSAERRGDQRRRRVCI